MMIVGRVVNLSTEDAKLTPDSVGLLNIGEESSSTNIFKLKLNISEVKTFSLFEGEVIVCQGYNDSNSKFNVNQIHKPEIPRPLANHSYDFLARCRDM